MRADKRPHVGLSSDDEKGNEGTMNSTRRREVKGLAKINHQIDLALDSQD